VRVRVVIQLEENHHLRGTIAKLEREKRELQRLVDRQGELISFYQKVVEKLRSENQYLKRMIRKDLTIEAVKYRELEPHFDQLKKVILKLVVDLCSKRLKPIHKDEILRAFRTRYPHLKNVKDETVFRRLRSLRQEGALTSPTRGAYYMGTIRFKYS